MKNPIFYFENTTKTGIDEIPLFSVVTIKSLSIQLIKTNQGSLTSSSTVQDFLDDGTLYEEIKPQTIFVSGNANLRSNTLIACESSGIDLGTGVTSYTLTLPSSPKDGDVIRISDKNSNSQGRPVLIERNSNKIDGIADNLTLDVNWFDIKLIFEVDNWVLSGK